MNDPIRIGAEYLYRHHRSHSDMRRDDFPFIEIKMVTDREFVGTAIDTECKILYNYKWGLPCVG